MFGLEILDVVIGLMLVYLLLALFATALNEYIAAVLNLRGKELARGLGRLLEDVDEEDTVEKAAKGLRVKAENVGTSLTTQFYNHPLIRPLATREGWLTRLLRVRSWKRNGWRISIPDKPRLPSYIPARTFSMALLDLLQVRDPQAAQVNDQAGVESAAPETSPEVRTGESRPAAEESSVESSGAKAGESATPPETSTTQPPSGTGSSGSPVITGSTGSEAGEQARLMEILGMLKRESPLDVSELKGLLGNVNLPPAAQTRLLDAVTASQNRLQHLHDSVEVWFNNAMDRVSGAYKRTAQGWLFVLGLLIASCMNADTIDMWRRLESDDQLRAAMVRRAEAAVAAVDTTVSDSLANPSPESVAGTTTASTPTSTAAVSSAAGTQIVSLVSFQVPTDTADGDTAAGDTVSGDTARANPPPQTPETGDTNDTRADSAAEAVRVARENYKAARARLDSMELKLGWTQEEAIRVGLLRKDKPKSDSATGAAKGTQLAATRPDSVVKSDSMQAKRGGIPAGYHADLLFPFKSIAGFLKLIGLLLTALAISLGAPFWFDMLNKAISIRSAGRSPAERPKSPEGGPKRAAEQTPK